MPLMGFLSFDSVYLALLVEYLSTNFLELLSMLNLNLLMNKLAKQVDLNCCRGAAVMLSVP